MCDGNCRSCSDDSCRSHPDHESAWEADTYDRDDE